jgi:hypothetical protein
VGRGLSELQKRILSIVYERRQERDFEQEERDWKESTERNPYMKGWTYWVRYDLTHPHILAKLYDWPNRRGLRPSEGGRVYDHSSNFQRWWIGEDEYNRKTASYYRAVGRLKRRGLLTDRGAGLWLTDEGIRATEQLSVSNASQSSRVSIG